ncbi:hypothetical protein SLS58_007324 [Diplodia intermedia]|uniref:Uncharacterized protein n=1 Tax=Diplodia intermedia TaxID=856260 RepID=A0ABR3TL02_9PEZI
MPTTTPAPTTTITAAAAATPTPHTPRPLEGKLGIISGASRGIGASVARNLAAKGCSLVLNHTSDASAPLAAALAAELRGAHGVAAVAVQGDISTEEGCAAVVEGARGVFFGVGGGELGGREEKGELRIDVLVNNAAVQAKAYLGDVTPDEFWRVYKINVLGTGMAGYSIYGGTKGAVEAMTRVWARELAERATVNAVNIGPTMTDMYQDIPVEVLADVLKSWFPTAPLSAVRDADDDRMKYFADALGGRPGYPDEVAGVVAVLCLPESGWTTGGLIGANGGGRVSY